MRTARIRGESDIYHVVARGVGQQAIFETDADRQHYLDSLRSLIKELSGTLLAWCLMDNHVHLLVHQTLDDLSTMMRRLDSGYALYFNLVHGRSGHLFQGRFRSEPVDSDEYLMTVIRYIHQNPWKAGMTTSCSYQWSSYDMYARGEVPFGAEIVLDIFGGVEGFRAFHEQRDDKAGCIDVAKYRPRLDDDSARAIAQAVARECGCGSCGSAEIKSLPRDRRDAVLAAMKARGLTIRQIQRLTGLSLGVISQA